MKYEVSKTFFLKPKIKINGTKKKPIQEIKSITQRLYLQTYRRPSSITINLIQPLLWLILFGALFQNAPIQLFTNNNIEYREFLNPGIIVFTAFSNAINAGLPIIFDREFGFLNRILISPIENTKSLIYSCIAHSWMITSIQIIIISIFNSYQTKNLFTLNELFVTLTINTFLIVSIASLSICFAFILPGHIEFIAMTTLLVNLPTLFASTALAPLSFMPYWLQILVCINPLTYAVEILRENTLHGLSSLNTKIISTIWFHIEIKDSMLILITINLISYFLINIIMKYKYD